MPAARAYFDWNASAPLLAEARSAMIDALESAGNASSVHAEGRAKRATVERARADVASLVGARADNVVFTSGASEAAAHALTPHWTLGRAPLQYSHLCVMATEHPCVLAGGRFGAARTVLPVDRDGLLRLDALGDALAAHDRAGGHPLVAVQIANGETGVVQPVADIARIVKAAGGVLVCDAAQAAGRLPMDIAALGADILILSSHKMGGPQGAGAVVSASPILWPSPLVTGGGQESGHRSGTSNVTAIAGFGAAARVARASLEEVDALRRRRDRIEAELRIIAPDAIVHGARVDRLPNTIYVGIPGVKAETAQIGLDLDGVAVSAGSACSSGKVGRSHVLDAMGEDARLGAIRLSFGHATTEAETEHLLAALRRLVGRQRGAAIAAE